MIKLLKFCAILFSLFYSSALNAVEPENIMVIEVEGEANGVIEIELLNLQTNSKKWVRTRILIIFSDFFY